jgi:ATP-dependent RNA helicase SUPV3L1/SUV3
MPDGSSISALLGPTNTGKTHRAVERMLSYDSGMIGLPLRLLAREVYDRITMRIGEARVALVTGEEKRLPRRPDYWVCTVESMPIGCEVDFLAIDEIQLAAHDQRGHVFTERLQSARGRRETWFMGAETMRPLLSELVPTAKLVEHPRLSRLTSAGADKLSRMPPRTALVGFSTPQVYEIAERVRGLRGGTAVVLGALSPRTRNAQVALFQSGEVDYLVATDAIGMGLNLEVNHVAFAALRKFDGCSVRDLDPAELAQIAGRAGRYLNDGTFGTVAPIELPAGIAAAIEAHRFAPVRRVLWRSSDLDTSSIDSLIASLGQRPRSKRLKLIEGAEDTEALIRLAQNPDIRLRARGSEAVGLLWNVCRIPDFRKLLVEAHVALLADIFQQLAGTHAMIDSDWMAARVDAIDDTEGDIDTLTARIASIRTWTYISHQTRWVGDAADWQERTRQIEDRLSDALHDRLVQRFVERGAGKRCSPAKPRQRRQKGADTPAEPAASHPFASLSSLRHALAPVQAAGPSRDVAAWVESVVAAAHGELSVDDRARIFYGGAELGRLTPGQSLLLPDAQLTGHDTLGQAARSRILRRLVACARDLVQELLSPLRAVPSRELSARVRGIVYQLEQGLGTFVLRPEGDPMGELDAREHEQLRALDVAIGARVVYVQSLLKREAIERRLALCRVYFEPHGRFTGPHPGAVSLVPARGVHLKAYAAIGYPVFASRAIRADVIERLHQALAGGAEDERPAPGKLASWIGCSVREIPRIAEALGDSCAGGDYDRAHEGRSVD